MALLPCKECGKTVSTSAKACPHCGAPPPRKEVGCLTVFIIAGVCFALFVIVNSIEFFYQHGGQGSTQPSPPPRRSLPQKAAAPATKPQPKPAPITDSTVILSVWNDTKKNPPHPDASIRISGDFTWRLPKSFHAYGCDKYTATAPIGKECVINLLPEGPTGEVIPIDFKLTDKMGMKETDKDQADRTIFIIFDDDGYKIEGTPIKALRNEFGFYRKRAQQKPVRRNDAWMCARSIIKDRGAYPYPDYEVDGQNAFDGVTPLGNGVYLIKIWASPKGQLSPVLHEFRLKEMWNDLWLPDGEIQVR